MRLKFCITNGYTSQASRTESMSSDSDGNGLDGGYKGYSTTEFVYAVVLVVLLSVSRCQLFYWVCRNAMSTAYEAASRLQDLHSKILTVASFLRRSAYNTLQSIIFQLLSLTVGRLSSIAKMNACTVLFPFMVDPDIPCNSCLVCCSNSIPFHQEIFFVNHLENLGIQVIFGMETFTVC